MSRICERFRAKLIGIACFSLALGRAPAGWALDPATTLASYARQTWTMENGLPQNTVTALTQTRLGFVWLGTEVGLVRFDGNNFQLFDRSSLPGLPDNDVCCLLEADDGAFWVGTSAGLARWKDGMVKAFTTRNGLPGNGIRGLASIEGRLWVNTDQGTAQQNADKFIATPGTGGFWTDISQADQTLTSSWKRSAEQVGLPSDTIEFHAGLSGGQTAIATKSVLLIVRGDRVQQRLSAGKELPGNRIQALFADREGCLWIGTNSGLARLTAGKLQTLPVTDPLATASVLALIEDREGNVWVGTESNGLHILREQRFKIVGTRDGLASEATTAVVEDKAGTLWVGTQDAGVSALNLGAGSAAKTRYFALRDGLMSNLILSLASAPNGDVWVGTPDGLNRIHGSKVDAFTSADGLPDDFIRSLLVDADGSLWIGSRRGLVHWINAQGSTAGASSQPKMEIFTRANGLGSDTVGAIARDTKGDLWVATLAGLSQLHDGKFANYTTANGLSNNTVTALLPLGDGRLLIGTQDHGWDASDGRRFVAVNDVGGPGVSGRIDQTTIHAILDDSKGHLWLATGNGIARCDLEAESDSTGRAPVSHCVAFGTADGLRSREMASNSHPSAARSNDGRLWFATPKGLVEVDPAHFPVNTDPPPVSVERFAVDDINQPLSGSDAPLKIAAGHVRFQFDYAGLSFIAPLKVRYRYRLENFDRDWTDAGIRRAAYYTNIPPGKYVFRVQAANNDGVWNTTGAAIPFELAPHFYQTLWFYALLLAALAAGIIIVMKTRLRTAEREFRAVLGERSRIAREIHDTLAQGYVGISVQLEMLAQLLGQHKVDAATQQLDKTRDYVREGLADARQSIWALRTQDSAETTLPVRIRRMVEAAGDSELSAEFSAFGAYRPLAPGTERELLRIAQEAIHNVKKHAGARRLQVELKYQQSAIELEVRDDGKGGAPSGQETTARGGFGMTGMRERAAAIHGTLEVTSVAGEGTTVRLRAPAPAPMHEQTGEPE